jgi:hypothetical protein
MHAANSTQGGHESVVRLPNLKNAGWVMAMGILMPLSFCPRTA